MSAINKLVAKKEDHVKDFVLRASIAMQGTPLMDKLTERLGQHGCRVRFLETDTADAGEPGLIRWQRRISARFDEHEHLWVPVDPYTRFEATNMIYIHARELIARPDAIEALHGRIERLKRRLNLTNKHQVFLMIDDLEAHYRKRGKGSRAANADARRDGVEQVGKPALERSLAELQVRQRCFVVYVEGLEDAAEWVYNMTAGEYTPPLGAWISTHNSYSDIGVRPHKCVNFFFLFTVSSFLTTDFPPTE